MKIKYVGVLLAVIGASTLGLRSARAGCIESCDAVTKITASFMNAPSYHHEEVKLTGDGQTFTLVVDYTVAHVERDFGGCSASGSGAGEAASGLAMAAGALLLARRRRSRAA